MLNSMTGYGRGAAEANGRSLVLELRSVNHRYLDVSTRIPRPLLFLEEAVREGLSQGLSRGHVDVYLYYQNNRQDAREVQCNAALLESYAKAAEKVAADSGMIDDTRLYEWLRMPEVLTIEEKEDDQASILALCNQALVQAVEQLQDMRSREGRRMQEDIRQHVEKLSDLRQKIGMRTPLVTQEYRQKLYQRIEELLSDSVTLDENKLENEVAFFADKACIDEELVRLDSHFAQFYEMLAATEATGRKLDFLVQELNREVNTIGSKANDGEISRYVVDAKAEIEKIREQVQNIE